MNTHTGFCIICGYTTQVEKRRGGRLCPNGHGNLGVIYNKVVKVFLKKGMSGQERVQSLKEKLPNIYKSLMSEKDFEISIDFDIREPLTVTKPYGQIQSFSLYSRKQDLGYK